MGAGATFDWTLFDNSNRRKVVRRPSKLWCSTRIYFDVEAAIVEHLISWTKSGEQLCSINVNFD